MLTAQNVVKFALGHVTLSSRAALKLVRDIHIEPALQLHTSGDWGYQDMALWAANDQALLRGDEIRSVFHTSNGIGFVIITNLKQNRTLVLLSDEL